MSSRIFTTLSVIAAIAGPYGMPSLGHRRRNQPAAPPQTPEQQARAQLEAERKRERRAQKRRALAGTSHGRLVAITLRVAYAGARKMPAHELRKQILTRMWQDEALRLDALCIALSKSDRPLGRSVIVNKLVEDAYNALPEDVRAKATAAARQSISHHRPPDTEDTDETAAE